jgi:hypothetical protein
MRVCGKLDIDTGPRQPPTPDLDPDNPDPDLDPDNPDPDFDPTYFPNRTSLAGNRNGGPPPFAEAAPLSLVVVTAG